MNIYMNKKKAILITLIATTTASLAISSQFQSFVKHYLPFGHQHRIIASYPHEWPASMVKDIALYNLNAQFDSSTKAPYILNYTTSSNLFEKNNPKSLFQKLLAPIYSMAQKNFSQARKLLSGKQELETTNLEIVSDNNDFNTLCKEAAEKIKNIDVTPSGNVHQYKAGGYKSYYDEKNERFSINDQSGWQEKQKNVYKILKEHKPETVLDIGCNTGWFSMLAESMGAQVTATDIDEASLDYLYNYTKKYNANILPLQVSFEEMNENRFKSDMVLCLAIIHHLVFISGLTIDQLLQKLADMTTKTLVLEYIDWKDKSMIRGLNDPSIYNDPNTYNKVTQMFNTYAKENYNLDNIKKIGLKYFSKIESFASHPHTRTIIVLSK